MQWAKSFAQSGAGFYDSAMSKRSKQDALAPLPVRVTVFAVVVVIGIACVWLVDHRAMQRMHEMNAKTPPTSQNGNVK